MNRKNRISLLNKSLLYFFIISQAPISSAEFKVALSDDTIKVAGNEARKTVETGGEELRKSAPILAEQFSNKIMPAIGKQIKEIAPNVDANIGKASDAIAKAARSISSIRAVPIVGVGLAGAIISVSMLSRAIEKYIDADDEKQTNKAKWHILASLIGLGFSGCVMGYSSNILNFFSE